MTLEAVSGRLEGAADSRLLSIVQRMEDSLATDPDLSFQAAAYHDGALILDVWGGRHLDENSLMAPYSVSKNLIGFTVALLVDRGILDLDEPVARYWPEFAARGKQHISVRMLLSHQAGLPQTYPALKWTELLDLRAGAARLAASAPLWQPGAAFGYHAITIGNLAAELVLQASGRTLHDIYENDIRRPYGLDVYLGLPVGLEHRLRQALPMIPPVVPPPEPDWSALGPLVMNFDEPGVDVANDECSWRLGHPAVSACASARGLARLFAAGTTGVDDAPAFLSHDAVEQVSRLQVRGFDEVLAQHGRAHGIVFQKPSAQMPFGGPRAFGHDGARGAFACVDPATGVSFAYTVARGPWPGGADPRAVRLAAEIGAAFGAD